MIDPKNISTSGYVLIAANLVPLVGVLFFGWSTFEVMGLYWLENVVIGVLNVPRMLMSAGSVDLSKVQGAEMVEHKKMPALPVLARLPLALFFLVHYGIFTLVHGVFVAVITNLNGLDGGDPIDMARENLGSLSPFLLLNIGVLVGSHLFSFFHNWIGKKEYERTVVVVQMFRPYGRIVVLHIALLVGAFVTVLLGNSIGVLLVLVLGKIVLDLVLHNKEHKALEHGALKVD